MIPIVEELKAKARKTGLWNMFMPPHSGVPPLEDTFQFEGIQLTNMEYAPICEMFGRVGFASEVFNCSAPDTGNMEVIDRFGTLEQKGEVAAAADERRNPLGLPDDRARRGLVRRHQYRAIRAHGGAGVTSDFGLARMYASQRTLRLADGPDEVHNRTIARMEFAKYGDLHARVRAERDAERMPLGSR